MTLLSPGGPSRGTSPHAFTLVELLTVIAIIGILAAILVPVVGKVRDSARATKSLSNLKSIGQGLLLHASENRGQLPTLHNGSWGRQWTTQIEPYLVKSHRQNESSINGANVSVSPIFFDPLLGNGEHGTISDYGANRAVFPTGDPDVTKGLPLTRIPNPARTVLAVTALYVSAKSPSWYVEAQDFVNRGLNANVRPDDRGRGSYLTVFADGHSLAVPSDELLERRAELFLIE